MLEAILATLAVGASLLILGYLANLLFGAARGPLTSLLERQRFARHVTHAQRSDQLLQRQDLEGALKEIHSAFYLYSIHSRALASAVSNHHTGLLSRLIAITSEQQGGTVRLLSLAKADRLLSERSELLKRSFAARQGSPGERVRELQQRLDANTRELESALQNLIVEVRSSKRAPTFH